MTVYFRLLWRSINDRRQNRKATHNLWYFALYCQIYDFVFFFGAQILNGPGKFEAPSIRFTHVFSGFAKLHSFKFRENSSTILFSSRFLQTRVYDKSVNHGGRFPTINIDHVDPPLTILETIQSLFNGLDNTNVNVYTFGNNTVALTDSWDMYTFDKKSLQNATFIKAQLPDSLPWIYNKMAIQSVAHPMREYGSSATITVAIIGVDSVPFFGPSLNVIRAHSVDHMELIALIGLCTCIHLQSHQIM